MPSEKIFNRNSTDKPRPIGDPQWVLELKNKLLTNETLLLALQDAVESDLVKGEDTVCRWGSFFTRSDKRVMEKVANAAREYASQAARLGIVDAVEKSCDETKAGKGALKVHGKSHKVVVLGQASCGEGEVDSTEALLTAAETKQLTGLAALTESNKLERSIALEKKRKSDPFIVFDDNSNEVEDPSEEYTAEALVEDGTDLMVDGDKRDSIAWWGIRTDPVSTTHLISELKRRKEVKRLAVEAKRIMEKELEVQKRLEEQQASRERSREIERAQDRERAVVRAAEELKQRSYAANPQHAQASSSSSSYSVGGRGRVSFPQCSIVTGPSPSPAYFPQPPPHPVTLTFPSQKSITIPPAFKAPPAFPQQQHQHQQQKQQQQQQYEKHQNFSKVQAHSQSPHLSGTFPQRSIQRSSLDSNGDVISAPYPTPTLPSNDSAVAVAVGVISTSNHHHNNHHPVVFSFSSQATAAKTGRFSKPGTVISFGRRDGIGVGTSSSSSSSSTAGYGASFPNRSTVITSPSTSISTPTSSSSHTSNAEKVLSLNAGMPFDIYTLNASGSSSVSTVSKIVGSSYRQNNSIRGSHSTGDSINIVSDAAMMKKNTGNKETSSDYNTKEKRNFHDINSHKSDTSNGNNYGDNYNQKQNQNHGNGRRSSTERYDGKTDALDREREGSGRLSGTLRGREDDGRMDKGRGKQENNNQDVHRGRDNEGVDFRKESKTNAFNNSISISSSSSNGNTYGNANANANDSFHKRNNELHNSNKNVTESDSKFVSFPNKSGTYTPHQPHSNDNNSNSNNNSNNNYNNSSSSNYINSNSSHHNNSHHYNTNDNKFRSDGNTINNFNNNGSNNDISRDRAHHQNTFSSSIDNNHKNSSVNANDYKESTHTQKTFNSNPSSSDNRSRNGNINSNNNSNYSNNGNNQYDGNRNRNGDHEKGRSRSRSRSKGKGNGRGRSRGRSKDRSRSRDRDRDRVRGHTQQNRV